MKNKQNLTKFLSKVSAVALLLIMCFIFVACTENNEDFSHMIDHSYQAANVEIIKEDKYGHSAIKVNEDRDIKVLQLTAIDPLPR